MTSCPRDQAITIEFEYINDYQGQRYTGGSRRFRVRFAVNGIGPLRLHAEGDRGGGGRGDAAKGGDAYAHGVSLVLTTSRAPTIKERRVHSVHISRNLHRK